MSAPAGMDFPLPPLVLRNLSDRSFDKRKAGATEVEKIMKKIRETGDRASARRVLTLLATDFACSVNSNNRKGGLIGLASCAIGLGSMTSDYLDIMVPAVLKSFADGEPRVRYYACESLFNIAKVARGAMLNPFFNDVFVGVCRLVADVDADCKNGAALFDRLLKEIVLESFEERERVAATTAGGGGNSNSNSNSSYSSSPLLPGLDLSKFVPLLRQHMAVINPYVRQLLVGWITALDSVPGVDMVEWLPSLLGGLFDMLSDGNREVRQAAYAALAGFLDQLDRIPIEEWAERVAFGPLTETLLLQTGRERDKFNRVTAVEWLSRFISCGRGNLAPLFDRLVPTLLRCLSDPEAELVDEVARTNAELMMLVRTTPSQSFDATRLLGAIIGEASAKDRTTRSAALRWIAALLVQVPDVVRSSVDVLLPALLANLLDTGDGDVLKLDIEVLARLAVADGGMLVGRVLVDLVRLLGDHRPLLEAKASFVFRRLCLLLEPRIVYLALAKILEHEPNREFASLLVELLNLILLTSLETADFRDSLRGCGAPGSSSSSINAIVSHNSNNISAAAAAASSALTLGKYDSNHTSSSSSLSSSSTSSLVTTSSLAAAAAQPPIAVFLSLYRTWSTNPVAALSLCLLAQSYELASRIVSKLSELTVTVGLLMQVDKLVQLLESPIFLPTRMHLLQPEKPDAGALLRALYGLLMLLPQGTAFSTLRERLHAVTSLHISLRSNTSTSTATAIGSSNITASAVSLPFDIDEVFAIFADKQRQARESLSFELKSRSLLYAPPAPPPPLASSSSSSSSSKTASTSAVLVAAAAEKSTSVATTDITSSIAALQQQHDVVSIETAAIRRLENMDGGDAGGGVIGVTAKTEEKDTLPNEDLTTSTTTTIPQQQGGGGGGGKKSGNNKKKKSNGAATIEVVGGVEGGTFSAGKDDDE